MCNILESLDKLILFLSDDRKIVDTFIIRKTFFFYIFYRIISVACIPHHNWEIANWHLQNGKETEDYAENLHIHQVSESNRETENTET